MALDLVFPLNFVIFIVHNVYYAFQPGRNKWRLIISQKVYHSISTINGPLNCIYNTCGQMLIIISKKVPVDFKEL
jgi:hypothetical protein